jgi:hypothetical protein
MEGNSRIVNIFSLAVHRRVGNSQISNAGFFTDTEPNGLPTAKSNKVT